MFLHLFINRLKILVRDKEVLFWTFIFSIILGSLFYLAFSNLGAEETLEAIPIAIVGSIEDANLEQVLDIVSEGEDKFLEVEKIDAEDTAKEKLEQDEIKGYFIDGKLVMKEDGIDQTILKEFLDIYYQKSATVEEVITYHKGQINYQMIEEIMNTKDIIERTSYSKENPDTTVNYFYTLIGMACMYGGFWGVKEVMDIQANQSQRAKRMNIAPIHKLKVLSANLSATVIINFLSVLTLLAFLIFVLKIDFGSQIGLVLLTSFVGCIVGITMGMFIGSITKKDLNIKIGILLGVTMIGSFLAGMMMVDMKYLVQTYAPIVGYLNPVNLLTDALYALYYYETYDRYILNMAILGALSLFFVIGTYLKIRRQKYESV